MDCSPPDSSVYSIFQARMLVWVAISFSRRSQPKNQTHISCLAGRFLTAEPLGKPTETLKTPWSCQEPYLFETLQKKECRTFTALILITFPSLTQWFSPVWLFCSHMDCSLAGSSAHGIIQARILEWGAISYSRGSSWPRNWTCVYCVSCTGRLILYSSATWEAWLYNLSLFTRRVVGTGLEVLTYCVPLLPGKEIKPLFPSP